MNVPLDKDSASVRADTVYLHDRFNCLRINEVFKQSTSSVHGILSMDWRVSTLAVSMFDQVILYITLQVCSHSPEWGQE